MPDGWIDLQVNGCGGVDFSSPELTLDAARSACRAVLERGVAGFLATLVTAPVAVYERNLPLVGELATGELAGRLLGVHVEGPFLSPEPGYIGAHNPAWVQPPDPELLTRMHRWAGGTIKLLTLAAERPGAADLAHCARELGMIVSIGHSAFDEASLDRLAAAGATALTHLGNGLPNDLHRHHNPIWAGLADDRYTAMIIADGHHLPAALIKTILRVKGVARTIVVSDMVSLTGLPPGRYDRWGAVVELEPTGRIRHVERNCLAGSAVDLPRAMRHLASLDLLSDDELRQVGIDNPLALLGTG